MLSMKNERGVCVASHKLVYICLTLSFDSICIAVVRNLCLKTIIVRYMNTIGYKDERGVQVTNRIKEFDKT